MYLISKTTLYVILAVVAAIILTAVICKAESVVVSFDDAEHLAALTDSVVGVKDSIKVTEDRRIGDGIWEMEWHWQVTCRRLVCVTVTKRPYRGVTTWDTVNGKTVFADSTEVGRAIIFYEEVK